MMKSICKGLIRFYQLTLSPWVGRECRYIPTCSNYSLEAIERHGVLRGLYLTVRRILSCHPFGGRGYDPVPLKFSWRHHCPECASEKTKICDSKQSNPPQQSEK